MQERSEHFFECTDCSKCSFLSTCCGPEAQICAKLCIDGASDILACEIFLNDLINSSDLTDQLLAFQLIFEILCYFIAKAEVLSTDLSDKYLIGLSQSIVSLSFRQRHDCQ